MQCGQKRPVCRQRRYPQTDVQNCVRPNIYTTFLSVNRGCPWAHDLKRYYRSKRIGSSIERFVQHGSDTNDPESESELTEEQVTTIESIKCDLHLAAKMAQSTRVNYTNTNDKYSDSLKTLRQRYWVSVSDQIDAQTIKSIKLIIDHMHDVYDALLRQTTEYTNGIMSVESDESDRKFVEVVNEAGAVNMMIPMLYTLFDRGQHPWLNEIARPYLESLTQEHTELVTESIESPTVSETFRNRGLRILALSAARVARFVSAGSLHTIPSNDTEFSDLFQTQILGTADPLSLTIVIALDDRVTIHIEEMLEGRDKDGNLNHGKKLVSVTLRTGQMVIFDSRLRGSFVSTGNHPKQMIYLYLNVQDVNKTLEKYTHLKSFKAMDYGGERLLPIIHIDSNARRICENDDKDDNDVNDDNDGNDDNT